MTTSTGLVAQDELAVQDGLTTQDELNDEQQSELFWNILDNGYVGIVPFQHAVHGLTLLMVQQFAEPNQFGIAFYPGYGSSAPVSLVAGNQDTVVEQLLLGTMQSRWSFFPLDATFDPSMIELNALMSQE